MSANSFRRNLLRSKERGTFNFWRKGRIWRSNGRTQRKEERARERDSRRRNVMGSPSSGAGYVAGRDVDRGFI
jgi:hypothetical protein